MGAVTTEEYIAEYGDRLSDVADFLRTSDDSINVAFHLMNLKDCGIYSKELMDAAISTVGRKYRLNKCIFADVTTFADEYINHARQKLNI